MDCEPQRLTGLAARILVAAGAGPEEAQKVAARLVESDLVGHASHGVLRVKQYVEQIAKGQIRCRTEPAIVNEGPGFAVLEGNLGFGQVNAEIATRLACGKAREQGIGITALRNSAHVGRLGDWVELACELGCVSFHFVNTLAAPTVAPWGGRERRLSTNPLAWGMPVAGSEPIVVDLTTSVVAEGKVRLAKAAGKSIPPGWVVDKNGQSTTNPADLYDGGALLPLGGLDAGHKGYALSLMVDLMAGALSGGGASGQGRKVNCNNFTVIAIDAAKLHDDSTAALQAAEFVEWIKSATPTDAARPVLVPGDVERNARTARLAQGVPVDDGVLQALRDAAKLTGLNPGIVDQSLNITAPTTTATV